MSQISLVLVAALGGCNGEEATPPRVETQTQPPPPVEGLEVEDIEESPSRYYGRTVALAGEIEDVRNERAFVLEGDDWLFAEEMLVLTRSPIQLGVSGDLEDTDVIVTGTVRPMIVADLERELGWDLDPGVEAEFREKPVLVAESIRAMDEVARWSESEDPEGAIVSLWTIYTVPTPDALVGKKISVESIPVQSITGNGMWVGMAHAAQAFVAPGPGVDLSKFQVGDNVSLSGTLQRMPPAEEAISRWNIEPTLRPQIEQETLYIDAKSVNEAPSRPEQAAMRGGGPAGAGAQAGQGRMGGQAAGAGAGAAAVTFAQFSRAPEENVGRLVQGEATVTRVISDRAFGLRTDDGGEMVLAMVRADAPRAGMLDIEPGARLRFTAQSHGPRDLQAMRDPLDANVQQAIRDQPAFLAAHWRDVQIIGQPEAAPRG